MLDKLSAPTNVFLNLTNGCNLRCLYCSADSSVPGRTELTRAEWERVIDEVADLKVFAATVTGGEPLVRADALDLIERLVRRKIQVCLLTNGTMLKPGTVDRLVEIGVRTVNVSLDGTSARLHDATRGEGSFDRALQGVRNLLARGIRPSIMVTVTRLNAPEVTGIARELMDLSVASVAFNLVADLGRQRDHRDLLELRPGELAELADRFTAARSAHPGQVVDGLLKWHRLPGRLERSRSAPGVQPHLLPCGAARNSCAISAEGDVAPCNKLAEYRCGNLREQSLREIWLGPRMERVRDLAKVPTAASRGCAGCRYNRVCAGGCRAEAFLRFKDLEAPDPLCRVLADSAVHTYEPRPAGTA